MTLIIISGVASSRLDAICDELNEEITEGEMKHISADYQNMVEHWYEKIMDGIDYVRREPGNRFLFPLLNKVNTRKSLASSQAPITDESDANKEEFRQRVYMKEKISYDDPAIVSI